MWNYLPRNYLDFQREANIPKLEREIAELHAQGYAVECDRKLDELIEALRHPRSSRANT